MPESLRNVLVTHADQPLGRRLVKRLLYDERVDHVVAIGAGPPPRHFEAALRGPGERLHYLESDLTRHRAAHDVFHSPLVRRLRVSAVIHLPEHASPAPGSRPALAGVPDRVAEARLILQHCLELEHVHQLVAVGSAYVYRTQPGNANRMTEQSALDLDATLCAEARAWIDCDMLLHGEIGNEGLDVALLRVPTVVGRDGHLYLNPMMIGGPAPTLRVMGFDPMCSLIADKDVARAIALALHQRANGIFNIAAEESLPISVLAEWSGGASFAVPGPLLDGAARAARLLGAEALRMSLSRAHLRHGFTLDTRRAERELGFRPGYRIGLGRADDGRALIEASAR